MNDKLKKALETFFGDESVDFEKKSSEEDIAKAVELINEHYKADLPEDLEKAIGLIAKSAAGCVEAEVSEVNKAGAKFSKDAIKKLQAIIAAVEQLKSILPEADTATQKSVDGSELADFVSKLEGLKDVLSEVSKKGTKETDDTSELAKTLKGISERLEAIEKDGIKKTSIEGDDNDGGDKDSDKSTESKWPTLSGQRN